VQDGVFTDASTATAATTAVAVLQAREEYDVRVMQLAKQRREGVLKVVTGRGGVARYEARLDRAKHRATSRRRMKQSVWDDSSEEQQEE
jgi:hypothetical protein